MATSTSIISRAKFDTAMMEAMLRRSGITDHGGVHLPIDVYFQRKPSGDASTLRSAVQDATCSTCLSVSLDTDQLCAKVIIKHYSRAAMQRCIGQMIRLGRQHGCPYDGWGIEVQAAITACVVRDHDAWRYARHA